MHRELYEYFLGHCERHHYHTWGCQLPPGHSAAAGDVCSSSTLHSGCYRLYEGALSDAVYPDDAGDAAIAGPLSDPRGYAWQPQSNERAQPQPQPQQSQPQQQQQPLSGPGVPLGRSVSIPGDASMALGSSSIAASAPEPTWKRPNATGSASGTGSYRARPVMIHGHETRRTGAAAGASSRAHSSSHRQATIPHAGSAHWGTSSGGSRDSARTSRATAARMSQAGRPTAPVTAGQYVSVLATGDPSAPGHPSAPARPGPRTRPTGPDPARSISGNSGQTQPQSRVRQPHGPATEPPASGTPQLVDGVLSGYSACNIHMVSSGTSVRVSMAAVTPTCDTCQAESSREAHRRSERRHDQDRLWANAASGGGAPDDHRHRHGRRHSKSAADDAGDGGSMGTAQHRRCRHHSGRAGSSRVIDDLDSLFGPQHSREERRGARQHGSAGTGAGGLAGHIQRHSVDARNLRDEGTPLARWMASLSSDAITDPQADGLLGASSDRRKPL
ncbi:hypothetical protein IWQ56_005455, partial [Coemansia nantahalensis]